MIYSTIIVCLASMSPCDIDHVENAVHVEQSQPIFESMDQCFAAVQARLHNHPIPNVVEGTDYQLEVNCDAADPPKPA